MNIDFSTVSTCDYADALPREQFMDYTIHALCQSTSRLSGPAYTVKCEPGDHLMLHAAIYRASPGDVIVVEADDQFAVAGGNVCAIAQKRGIAGFVVDGLIRDIEEVDAMGFAVYARGVIPKPAAKQCVSPLNQPITCGGVTVCPNDIIVADREGIAVIPRSVAQHAFAVAQRRAAKDGSMTLDEWEANHSDNIEQILIKLGFTDT